MKMVAALLALVWLALAGGGLARAQMPAAKPDAAGDAQLAAQARAALEMLKDEKQRARLIGALEAIAQAQAQVPAPAQGQAKPAPAAKPAIPTIPGLPVPPGLASPAAPAAGAAAPPAAAAAVLPLPLEPDGVGVQLFDSMTRWLSNRADDVVSLSKSVTDFPLLLVWLGRLFTDATLQLALLDVAWRLAFVLGIGLGVEWSARRFVGRLVRRLRERAPPTATEIGADTDGLAEAEAGQTEWMRRKASVLHAARRVPFAVGDLLLNMLPIVAIAVTATALAGFTGTLTSRQVILTVLDAYIAWRGLVLLATAVAQPDAPRLRLIPVDDSQAAVIVVEASRIAAVGLGVAALADVAQLFGLYRIAHDALLKLDVLLIYLLVANIILRNRKDLRELLRARETGGLLVALRNGIASALHRIVIFYLLALWTVWALDIPDGFTRLLRFMVEIVVVVTVARVAIWLARAGISRIVAASQGLDERYPGAGERIAGYRSLLRGVVNLAITVVAGAALMQLWGFDVLDWFGPGTVGRQLLAALQTIIVTLLIAIGIWELSNIAIQRHLDRLNRDAQVTRSARLQTVLPILRTTLLACVFVITGLIVLSELGVNIAPLLAGAGVIGLAIGIGSQKLVQDIITGLFLLLENTMQVGDWVTLGGLSGTVENLSIRTIRLRAMDGSVHIVPFSAVTTVTNATRDFGYAVIDVSVGLNETPDRIADVLREVATGMRRDSAWRGLILSDLEVLGVERFITTAWVMRARIKTLPASRWAVGRELNRRIKQRFDELAVESPITSYRALGQATPAPQVIFDSGNNAS